MTETGGGVPESVGGGVPESTTGVPLSVPESAFPPSSLSPQAASKRASTSKRIKRPSSMERLPGVSGRGIRRVTRESR
jgi:hypothetical protein